MAITVTSIAQNATWNFKLKFSTMGGTSIYTTPVKTFPGIDGFTNLAVVDLSNYVCEGGQFKIENLSYSTGTMNCLSGASTITSNTQWDARFGFITIPGIGSPIFTGSGSYILDNQIWPVNPGVTINMPVNSAPFSLNNPGDPNIVSYLLAFAPVMGCQYFGLNNGNASCTRMIYCIIKVKRAAKPLNDITICPNTVITDALLGIPAGVTATNWLPSDPRVSTPNTTTIYTYTLSNGACPINDNVKITVNQPTAELFANTNSIVCYSELPFIGANIAYGPTSTAEIIVNGVNVYNGIDAEEIDTNYFVQSGPDDGAFRINTFGTFTIEYKYWTPGSAIICSKSYTVTVSKPIKFGSYTDKAMCSNSFSQICGPVPPAGTFYTYKWYGPTNGLPQGSTLLSTSSCFTPAMFGAYTLIVTDQYGCGSSVSFSLGFSPSANPNVNFNYSKQVSAGQVIYTATPLASNSINTWKLYRCSDALGNNEVELQSISSLAGSSVTFSPRPIGFYYKIRHYALSPPCMITKNISYTDYGNNTGKRMLEEEDELILNDQSLNIYPNPTNGKFNMEFNKASVQKITVYSVLGDIISEINIPSDSGNVSFDLSEQPNGIYFIRINAGENTMMKKIIKN